MGLVVVLAEVTAGGLVVATLAAALVGVTWALAEAVDSTAAARDSMVAVMDFTAEGAGSTLEAVGFMAAATETGPTATSGIVGIGAMVTTGITAIVGVTGTTTGTTGTTTDIGVGADGPIHGTTALVGVILGIRTTVTHMAATTAAIPAAETTEMAMRAGQGLPNCNADFHGPAITRVKSMESWALRLGEQFAATSATVGVEIPVHQCSSGNFLQ